MNKARFYPSIWTTIPYSSQFWSDWYSSPKAAPEVILSNAILDRQSVSEMEVSLLKIAAIDLEGREHALIEFNELEPVRIKGLVSGDFLKLSNTIPIQMGTYTCLRFYMGNGANRFVYSNGEIDTTNPLSHLDFKIQDNLEVRTSQQDELKLWFQLAPYTFGSYVRPFSNLFKKVKEQLPRLAGCIG
jgi:hypothetical protein